MLSQSLYINETMSKSRDNIKYNCRRNNSDKTETDLKQNLTRH